ncbi:HNH endonuclease [Cronobacter sakazakii]|uniref:HNH endonuclease n=1 Tax=Cronobacter sakazakii TaxID=28141 RepID=UPI0009B9C8BC|nr:HNH endonuclease [Cronobacter sakazakii]ELQ6143232.1 HNH endonuclease [Cronobacter sakazakii]ELY3783213.1 HNH endonuclease [Cronobacter sakazakii]PUX52618.1 HNH endonuclease [Cronobacter sakazakii]
MPGTKYKITEEWLRQRYMVDLMRKEDIAAEAGCSKANIDRLLAKWGIRRGSARISATPAWNQGKNKNNDERMKRLSEARTGAGNPMYGKTAWNTGLRADTDERVSAVSKKLLGKTISADTKEKLAAAKRGKLGDEANNYKGGVILKTNGYLMRLVGNNGVSQYEYVHRLIAKERLGRALRDNEHVHHINRNTVDNAPGNLVALPEDAHIRLPHDMRDEVWSWERQREWLIANGYEFVKIDEVTA